MQIDTFALQCFLAVAETGSVTKAAERVGRTQSAVSQQMAKLETLVDKTLFIRGKTFALTPEGQIFLGYAQQIYALLREMLDRFKDPDLTGEVRFGLPEDFASVYLSDVLVDFVRLHPRILLNIECDLTLNLFRRFKDKEFDLVLVKMTRPDDFPNGIDVWTEDLEWVGNANEINFSRPLPLVLSPNPCVYRSQALEALQKAGIKGRLAFTSPSFASTVAAVKAGMGITVLPRTLVPPFLQVLNTHRLPRLSDIHVSLLKHTKENPAINSFEGFVARRLQ